MTLTASLLCLVVGFAAFSFTQGKRSATAKPCRKNLGAYIPPKNIFVDKWRKYKKSCSNKVITNIGDFKCYQASRSDKQYVRARVGWCSCAQGLVARKFQANVSTYSNHATYLIPRPDQHQLDQYPVLSPPLSLIKKLFPDTSASAATNNKGDPINSMILVATGLLSGIQFIKKPKHSKLNHTEKLNQPVTQLTKPCIYTSNSRGNRYKPHDFLPTSICVHTHSQVRWHYREGPTSAWARGQTRMPHGGRSAMAAGAATAVPQLTCPTPT